MARIACSAGSTARAAAWLERGRVRRRALASSSPARSRRAAHGPRGRL